VVPLMLTVEHEDGEWSEERGRWPEDGCAVIKLNGHEVKRIELRYYGEGHDREALERYAAEWLAFSPRCQGGRPVTAPKPPSLKLPCPAGGHRAKVSDFTGLIKPHTRNGIKCPGSRQLPRRRFW
jgi:hypothetical protein